MNKAHTNVNWENLPSTNTPLNQQNLNKMDNAIDVIDNRVIVHDNEITQLQGYETRAAQSATAAANSASTASTKATAAATSATNSENFYKYSKSYAVGGTGIRSGEDTDNSKYYYEQVKSMASGGHAIMDSDGTAMAGRSILQFANSRVKDDATNDKTIVAPAHGHTNLLNPTLGTTTSNGVKCTNNGDGTYTVTGAVASGNIANFVIEDNFELPLNVPLKLVGCPQGGGTSPSNIIYKLALFDHAAQHQIRYDYGNGSSAYTNDGTYSTFRMHLAVYAGAGTVNLTFKPMISTDLSVDYDDFVKYSGSEEGLNAQVASLHDSSKGVITNLLNPTLGTTTVSGITCTANGNGTYTLNGTSSSQPGLILCAVSGLSGKHKLIGCPSGGGQYTFNISYRVDDVWSSKYETGNGLVIDCDPTKTYQFEFVVRANQTLNNVTFKPMLTADLDATYDDFVQYSGNGKLNENVASLYEGLESTDSNVTAVTTKANNIQSQIVTSGNIENGNTATSAHTVGTYIQWKGKFYVVTSAIAVGDTLAIGTNLAAKTVGEVLTQINADLTDNKTWKSYGTAGITQVAELMKGVANSITIPKTASELVIIGNEWSATVPLITGINRDISFYYGGNYLCNGFVSIDAQYIEGVNKVIVFSTCVTQIGAMDIITGRGKITGIYYR